VVQSLSSHYFISTTMFKSAAAKLAHNSTLPSLNITGNKDLKPLQDLITAEKAVLASLQRLNADFNRASEALRVWGNGEGEDLEDVLNASCNILGYFTASLLTYATHEQVIRDHMKAVRTREEALDELKRRRKSVGAKADAAEKKLQKMNSENKNLPGQTDLLNRLRDEMRTLDGEIMNEEASIGDFKRQSTLEWMSLKFGGLAEVSGKGVVSRLPSTDFLV
jgi:chromosome segregation ATPase